MPRLLIAEQSFVCTTAAIELGLTTCLKRKRSVRLQAGESAKNLIPTVTGDTDEN